MPIISVIIPIYNAELTLRRCLDSILTQTFTNFECLLINDGSKDRSGEICDEYASKDGRFRVFHQENSGPSAARNVGLTQAKGQYIIFQDSDDYLLDSNAYLKLITYAFHNKLDVLRFDYLVVDKNGNILGPRPLDNKVQLSGKVFSPAVLVKEAFCGEWFTVLCLINRSIIGNLRFNRRLTFLEDMDFYARLLSSANLRCGYIPEHFYAYSQVDNSLSKSGKDSNFECSFALCDVFDELADIVVDKEMEEIYRYDSVMMYYWTLAAISDISERLHRIDIIRKYNVNSVHRQTVRRLNKVKGIGKYLILIIPSPTIAIRLLRLRTRIVVLLRSTSVRGNFCD